MRKVHAHESAVLATLAGWIYGTPLYGVLAFICARRVVVRGASMHPLLVQDERVLIDRLAFVADQPRRGDVVLARRPGPAALPVLKLVVALPGERVRIVRDKLWINGCLLRMPPDRVIAPPGDWLLDSGEYFLFSANTTYGADSRHFGPLPRASLLGRATRVFWPLARMRRIAAAPLLLPQDAAPAQDCAPT